MLCVIQNPRAIVTSGSQMGMKCSVVSVGDVRIFFIGFRGGFLCGVDWSNGAWAKVLHLATLMNCQLKIFTAGHGRTKTILRRGAFHIGQIKHYEQCRTRL